MKTSINQIWMVCHLLPFAKVGHISVEMYVSVILCGNALIFFNDKI